MRKSVHIRRLKQQHKVQAVGKSIQPAEQDIWYNALRLTERDSVSKRTNHKELSFDPELASRRFSKWQQECFNINQDLFDLRLHDFGVNAESFHIILGLKSNSNPNTFEKGWLDGVAESHSKPYKSEISICGTPEESVVNGFLGLVDPLVNQSLAQIRLCFGASIQCEGDLVKQLQHRLFKAICRTLILELNIARVEKGLKGGTPEDRFLDFCKKIQTSEERKRIYSNYPVLYRLICEICENWVRVTGTFLIRLYSDQNILFETLFDKCSPSPVVSIESDVGDTHRGGQSVQILCFEDGRKVVYKPRDLRIDLFFTKVVQWVNGCGFKPGLSMPRILERPGYGWIEHIEHSECTTTSELARFYRRQGGLIALFHALGATDLHYENLIASGERAFPIDIETLLQPTSYGASGRGVDELTGEVLAKSIMRTGMIPQRIWENAHNEGVDISGLGAPPGQFMPEKTPLLQNLASDEMCLVRQQFEISTAKNRPSSDPKVTPLEYLEEILAGFRQVYRLILERRDEFIGTSGLIEEAKDLEIRVIFRSTRSYYTLLRESFHPNLLRDALDRERFFDRLWGSVNENPSLARLINAELDDLWSGDIPMFTTRPRSVDLWTAKDQRLTNFFAKGGLESSSQRISSFCEADLQRQLWLLETAIIATVPKPLLEFNSPISSNNLAPREFDSTSKQGNQFVKAAIEIAIWLDQMSIPGYNGRNWVGLSFDGNVSWNFRCLGLDLYGGLPGVALFFAWFYRIDCNPRWRRAALDAINEINFLLQLEPKLTSLGGFAGFGGLIYAFANMAVALDMPQLLEVAEDLISKAPIDNGADMEADVIDGVAGYALALASFLKKRKSDLALLHLRYCGQILLNTRVETPFGYAWRSDGLSVLPLTGFSHGCAGISAGLLAISKATGLPGMSEMAMAAIEYERRLFDAEQENWLDLRGAKHDANSMRQLKAFSGSVAWCHGAPGIGLSRLIALRMFEDPIIRQEIFTSLRTTMRHGFGSGHSLCHGDLGNLELPLAVSRELGSQESLTFCKVHAPQIISDASRRGWRCGSMEGVQIPGLMTGLAGIGLQLLRLEFPEDIPSILTLE